MADEARKPVLELWRSSTGGFQLSIGDAAGGYRIFGAKFDGRSELLRRHEISERDADEIRHYLDLAENQEG